MWGQSFCFLLARNRKVSFFCLLLTIHTSPTQTQNLGIETEEKKDKRGSIFAEPGLSFGG